MTSKMPKESKRTTTWKKHKQMNQKHKNTQMTMKYGKLQNESNKCEKND